MRTARIERNTAETQVLLSLCLDGRGSAKVATGVGFLDHMLELFARHGRFDLEVACTGDTRVDAHHTTEDVGICLGRAFKQALGEKRGICRYGNSILPMDEALILSAVDISGRGRLEYGLSAASPKVGDFDAELVEEFFQALAANAGITLHLVQLAGKNTHHIFEGAFKSTARSLRQAVAAEQEFAGEIPSTKGVLE